MGDCFMSKKQNISSDNVTLKLKQNEIEKKLSYTKDNKKR